MQTSKNTLNTYLVSKNGSDYHDQASCNNRPSFLYLRNLGSAPPLLVYPGKIVYLSYH